jgi:hypothetical protein
MDWNKHKMECKKPQIIFEDAAKDICKLLHDSDNVNINAMDYFGSRMVGKYKVMFFKELGDIKGLDGTKYGDIQEWLASPKRTVQLVGDEFARYYSVGKCSISAFAVAKAIHNLSKTRIVTFGGIPIEHVFMLGIQVTKSYTPMAFSYIQPVPSLERTDMENWDMEYLSNNKHQVAAIMLKDGSKYIIDFAAAQYEIYTKTKCGTGWLYVEKLNFEFPDFKGLHENNFTFDDTEESMKYYVLSYGYLLEITVIDDRFVGYSTNGSFKMRAHSAIATGLAKKIYEKLN